MLLMKDAIALDHQSYLLGRSVYAHSHAVTEAGMV